MPEGKHFYEFGPFRLDPVERLLLRNNQTIPLAPKAFETLLLLVENSGHLLTKDELLKRLWPDTFVEEVNLAQNISAIRKALNGKGDEQYIETVPKGGYRFVADTRRVSRESPSLLAPPAAPVRVSPPALTPERRKQSRIGILSGAAVLVISAAVLPFVWRSGIFHPKDTSPAASAQIHSIAVLPLANLSGDPAQDYFADGMTEELTTDLGQISALRVISRTSAMHYKGTNKTLPEIARELHVDAVVEGSVERVGERVRITAQLVEAPTDRHLWARRYERDLRDVLRLQDEVAQAIAEEIKVKLTPEEQIHLANARPVNAQAHEADLRGYYELRRHTPAGLYVAGQGEAIEKSIKYFQQAVALDPNDALAYAGLADAYYDQSTFLRAPLEVMPKAKAAAVRAVELDETFAEAHASLGYVKLTFDWDWPGAEREFRRALELNPNLPRAHAGYAHYLLVMRRMDEAIQELDRVQKIDPLFPQSHMGLPWLLLSGRRYEQAIEAARKSGDDRVLAISLRSWAEGRKRLPLQIAPLNPHRIR